MKKDNDYHGILKALSLMIQLGLTMASCVTIGLLIGKFLDRMMGTSPWLMLIFTFIGAAAAFKSLYDIVIKEWNK